MRRLQAVGIVMIITAFILSCFFGCSSGGQIRSSKESEAPSEAQIALSSTEYNLDTLWNDLLKYCCEESNSEWYSFYLNDSIEYLKDNSSAEKLVNKELLRRMEEKGISYDSIFDFVYLFTNSWNENRSFMIWDEIYGAYKPLYIEELYRKSEDYGTIGRQTENAFYQKMCQTIKEHLRDPNSLYFSFEPSEYIGDHLMIDFYVCCMNGDTSYYINSEGKYMGKIYFYITFSARNVFGGYDSMGAWLTYNEYGRIQWTGITGGSDKYAKYDATFKLYGDDQELEHVAGIFIIKEDLIGIE